MAYKAGSVIVDIIAKADALRQTFKQARDSINEFGSQVSTTDRTVRGLGQTIASSMAEPKSVFGWMNKLNDTLKNIDYVAGRGFVSTGKSAKQLAADAQQAAEMAAAAQNKMAQAVENAQQRVTNAQSKVSAASSALSDAMMARQAAEVTAMEANKARVVQDAEKKYQDAMNRSAQASNRAYLATLKHMQLNSAASKVAKDEADARLKLAQATEQEAKANLSAVRNANPSVIPNVLPNTDASVQNLKNAAANEAKAAAALQAAKASDQAAKASLAEAQAAQQAAGAINGETNAVNRNSQAKQQNANASRQARMADLDLIFAAMYAEMAFGALLSKLSDVTTKGMEARNALMGLEAVVRSNGQSVDQAKSIFQDFKKDGLMSDAEIATSMKNLTLVGYSLDDSAKMMDRFKDSAAFGKQASLGFGEAIVRTTEGIRLGMSTLSDGAGMAKNLGQILKENGYTEKDLSRITTDAGVRMALFNGIMKETAHSAGDAALLTKDLGGSFAALKTSMNDLNTSVLTALSGVLNAIAQAMIPIVKWMKQWIDEHPRLTALIIILTTTILALVTIMLSFEFLFPMIMKGFKELGVIISFLTSPIGIVIAIIIVLGIVFAANKDMILEACSELARGWGDYFKSIWDYTKAFCSDMGDMFKGLGKIILGAMSFDKGMIEEGINQLKAGWYNAGQEIQAVGRATSRVWEGTVEVVSAKLNPVTLFGNAYDKVKSIFDPVTVDLSGKRVVQRSTNDDEDEDEKKKKGKQGPSPYQIAMREYEHRVHMDELKEYDEKIAALAKIGTAVAMTSEERMDYEEKVHDLIKEHTEDEKKYAMELMDFQIKTGEKTVEDKIKLLDEQIAAETDRHKKLQLQDQKFEAMQQLKQYDKDYLDYQVDTGAKSLQDKLDNINKELAAEKNKFNQLRLLREKFDTERSLNNKNAENEVKGLTDQYNLKDKNGNYRTIDSSLNINKTIKNLTVIAEKYDKMGEAGKEAAKKARDAIKELQSVTDQWVDKFTDGLAQVIMGGQKLSQFMDKMFSDIAMSFAKYQLNRLLGGLFTNVFGGMPWLGGKKHDGGMITKFHTGGLVGGLESDERVIIAQTGERVLNRRETKAFDAATKMAGGGGRVVNYYNINTMDASSFREFAYKNRDTIGAAAAADAIDGGAMARAMKVVR